MLSCGHAFDAVEAERAVEVAGLVRQEQVELAAAPRAALPRRQSCVVQPAQTSGCAHLDLERRDERAGELELADRADVLAEAGAAEERVDDEGRGEVGDEQDRRSRPGRPRDRTPRRPRRRRASSAAASHFERSARGQARVAEAEPLAELARQRERAGHAEEVAGDEQAEHGKRPPQVQARRRRGSPRRPARPRIRRRRPRRPRARSAACSDAPAAARSAGTGR